MEITPTIALLATAGMILLFKFLKWSLTWTHYCPKCGTKMEREEHGYDHLEIEFCPKCFKKSLKKAKSK
jgi:DNA replicative helicase MCM subunit Mcm2 (Cdc46/Mcm family)